MTTFHALLRDGASRHGERPAILMDDVVLSHAALLARVEALAAGLQREGVRADDRVAIVMDNSLNSLLAWLAVSVLGATDVPINPQYRGELLFYLLGDAEASVAICDAASWPKVDELAGRLPLLRLAVIDGVIGCTSEAVRLVSLDDCLAESGDLAEMDVAGERVLLYTSGTTGPSKGVIHTQASMLTLSRYNAEVLGYGPQDRLLNFFPLYHQNARYTGVVPALLAGASIRVERKLSTSGFWRTCIADGTTAFNYLGSVLRLILNATPPELTAADHGIRKAFGAGAPPLLWEAFETRLGVRLFEVYGLSEAPMATVNVARDGRRPPVGSAGRSSELFEVAVVDPADRMLPPGEAGEIVMRPRRPDAMMLGYHGKDAATVAAFRNLWFHSGDRGFLTADGDLFFAEREKDAIRRRGENISAWEVESVLDRHPDVAESAVFGVPSDEADEEVAAALVLRRAEADLLDILAHAERNLPRHAVPTLIRVMPDLPRTPTEKVQKAELRRADRALLQSRAALAAART